MADSYDVIIIGGGAAALTSSIYTGRKKLKTIILTVDVGGQNLLTESEENYPGYLETSGPKLISMMQQQAEKFGAEIILGKAVKVDKIDDDQFEVALASGEKFNSKILILAFGKIPRSLGVAGEDKFLGRGISTCATCDAPLFGNKNVGVIGGGNSALEAAELLSKFANKVYLIHRREEFRADPITVDKVKSSPKVEFILNSSISEFKGDEKFEGAIVENSKTGEKKDLDLDGIFLEIGYIVDTDFVKHLVDVNELKEIIINKKGETSHPGIFAAGDVTDSPFKQTVTAAGEGSVAALSAYNYLRAKEGKPAIKVDWD